MIRTGAGEKHTTALNREVQRYTIRHQVFQDWRRLFPKQERMHSVFGNVGQAPYWPESRKILQVGAESAFDGWIRKKREDSSEVPVERQGISEAGKSEPRLPRSAKVMSE